MEEKEKGMSIDIELPADVAEGIYSNLAMITHSPTEFVVDFVQILPGVPKPKVKRRIILTPQHAKRLLYALKDNIEKYERSNGEIVEPTGDKSRILPYNMGTIGDA